MGSLFDLIEAGGSEHRVSSQPLGPALSRPPELVPATGILEVSASQPLGQSQPLGPKMSNKEQIGFLRDYYSTPPDNLRSQPLGPVKINHCCLRCDHEWKSLNPSPKQCPSCFSHKWRRI